MKISEEMMAGFYRENQARDVYTVAGPAGNVFMTQFNLRAD